MIQQHKQQLNILNNKNKSKNSVSSISSEALLVFNQHENHYKKKIQNNNVIMVKNTELNLNEIKHRNKHTKPPSNKNNLFANENKTDSFIHNEIYNFVSRINRLRFIDDSATSTTSTAVTSPVELKKNPFPFSNSRDINDVKNRNYLKSLKRDSKVNITTSESSTETLCSDDDLEAIINKNKKLSDYDNNDKEIEYLTKLGESNKIKNRKLPNHAFIPSNIRNRHRYRHRETSTGTSTSVTSDTDSTTTDQELDRRVHKRLIQKNLIKMKKNNESDVNDNQNHNKSELDEKYFMRQLPNTSSEFSSKDSIHFDGNGVIFEDDEDENEDGDYNNCLVEDGFIRMSSPALTLDDEDSLFSDYNFCEQCKSKSSDNFNSTTRFLICSCYLKNFPNVGSSPVFDENSEYFDSVDSQNKEFIHDNFNNNIFDDDDSDDDDNMAKNEENIHGYDENDIEDDLEGVTNIEQVYDDYDEEQDQELEEQDNENENEENLKKEDEDDEDDDVDEIIIHNTIENSKILPIETSLIDTKQKKSIIKKSSFGILKQILNSLDDPLITQQNTLSNEKVAQINQSDNLENHLPNTNHTKPKVRFNLDLNYEKEREWNRINKILGDVSKSTIEWTDEVEV